MASVMLGRKGCDLSRLGKITLIITTAVLTEAYILAIFYNGTSNVPYIFAGIMTLTEGGLVWITRSKRKEYAIGTSQTQRIIAYLSCAFVFMAIIGQFHSNAFPLILMATVLIYGVAGLGINIQLGSCGVVNFAGAAFFGIGAYSTALLSSLRWIPGLAGIVLSGLAASVLGAVLLLPVLRTSGHYAALVTIAFSILFEIFLNASSIFGGPQGLSIGTASIFGWNLNNDVSLGGVHFVFAANYFLVSAGAFAITLTIVTLLERSWIGLAFDAVRIDEVSAACFGINVAKAKISSFMIGNFFIGVAGSLFAMLQGFVAPSNFSFNDSLIIISIVILGGIGNPLGILPAAAFILMVPVELQAIQEYRFLMFGVAVLVVLMFKPDGLFPRRLRRHV